MVYTALLIYTNLSMSRSTSIIVFPVILHRKGVNIIIVKALLSVQCKLKNIYKSCLGAMHESLFIYSNNCTIVTCYTHQYIYNVTRRG